MEFFALNKEDYEEPRCLLCMEPPGSAPRVRPIPLDRVIRKLDEHLSHNDYEAGERHLCYWLAEAQNGADERGMLAVYNELMGLYRKTGRREDALRCLVHALDLVEKLELTQTVTGGTTYVNAATVYKAFGKPQESLPVFEKAKAVYEATLDAGDARLGGLYNNMGLTFADLRRFDEAHDCYAHALRVMEQNKNGEAEAAVTHLNIADALAAEHGTEQAEAQIFEHLETAYSLLNTPTLPRDGYYAFVCEKCAPTFGYYGLFLYENELKERARSIYERP